MKELKMRMESPKERFYVSSESMSRRQDEIWDNVVILFQRGIETCSNLGVHSQGVCLEVGIMRICKATNVSIAHVAIEMLRVLPVSDIEVKGWSPCGTEGGHEPKGEPGQDSSFVERRLFESLLSWPSASTPLVLTSCVKSGGVHSAGSPMLSRKLANS